MTNRGDSAGICAWLAFTEARPDDRRLGLNVKIESPAEGETINCRVGRGPLSERFLELPGGA